MIKRILEQLSSTSVGEKVTLISSVIPDYISPYDGPAVKYPLSGKSGNAGLTISNLYFILILLTFLS